MVTTPQVPISPNPEFWRGRRVALTGHTGFKGAWLALLLTRFGAKVSGYALLPSTQPSLFDTAEVEKFVVGEFADIRDVQGVTNWLRGYQPEVVLHLAAQALVRASYADPVNTMTSNFNGTLNVLEAARHLPSVKSIVVVTTDKVYRNLESAQAFSEDDHLGGHDPYSASKAACEILVASYRACFLQHLGVATARAGNVIGGGDWSPDRLIPDAVKAWQKNEMLDIRRPDAVRPWQHVLEPLCAYLVLAERLFAEPQLGAGYNFGPEKKDAVSVREVIQIAHSIFAKGTVKFAEEKQGPHEAGLLHLDISKAKTQLGIAPRWDLETSIQRTMNWYVEQSNGGDARALCERDIDAFLSLKV